MGRGEKKGRGIRTGVGARERRGSGRDGLGLGGGVVGAKETRYCH